MDSGWRDAPSTSRTSMKLRRICFWDYQVLWPRADCVEDFVAVESGPSALWFRTLSRRELTRSHRPRQCRAVPCRWIWWSLWRCRPTHRWRWIPSRSSWRFCRKLRFELRGRGRRTERNFFIVIVRRETLAISDIRHTYTCCVWLAVGKLKKKFFAEILSHLREWLDELWSSDRSHETQNRQTLRGARWSWNEFCGTFCRSFFCVCLELFSQMERGHSTRSLSKLM